MAENFVFEVRRQIGYDELLPSTNSKAILNSCVKKIVNITLNPASTGTQALGKSELTEDIADAPFDVILVSGSQEDYATLSELRVTRFTLTIRRLYFAQQNPLELMLVFYDEGSVGA